MVNQLRFVVKNVEICSECKNENIVYVEKSPYFLPLFIRFVVGVYGTGPVPIPPPVDKDYTLCVLHVDSGEKVCILNYLSSKLRYIPERKFVLGVVPRTPYIHVRAIGKEPVRHTVIEYDCYLVVNRLGKYKVWIEKYEEPYYYHT